MRPIAEANSQSRRDARDLLTEDVTHRGWEHTLARNRSYYVRGATWFRSKVLPAATEIRRFSPRALQALDSWLDVPREGFDWNEPFSPRQAMDALSMTQRTPVLFTKAVLTIVCCEMAFRDKFGPEFDLTDSPLLRMRIEPAVFYIPDFDFNELDRLVGNRPQILDVLREETGQRTRAVFQDMAAGRTVTKRLAQATLSILRNNFPDEYFSDVDFRYRPRALPASLRETLSE